MRNPFVPSVGAVFSADIAVPEHEREVRFYSRVLGTGDAPLWRPDLMNDRGIPIIGLGPVSAEHAHLPLQWMPHIQVADVAESVRRALPLGGSELMHARDDAGSSQWAVLLDPNGAAFGIIPVVAAQQLPPGGGASKPQGRIEWLDLTVSGASTTRDFYCHVVGWSVQDVEMRDGDASYADFRMLSDDGKPVAGIRHARGPNAGLPPGWLLHLPVGDLDESVRRVKQEGGSVIGTTPGSDGKHASVAIQDPVGAHFALVQG